MASIKTIIVLLSLVLLVAAIIDSSSGFQIGGAEGDVLVAPPPAPPAPIATSAPVAPPAPIAPPVAVAPIAPAVVTQPVAPAPVAPQVDTNMFSFTIGNKNFKVGAFKADNGISHLIYFDNGTVRTVSPLYNYTFTDRTKDGKTVTKSVFALRNPRSVSVARLNDNLTYFLMFHKDFKLKENLRKFNNAELNRLISVIETKGAQGKSVKIVRTPTNTNVLYDNAFGAPLDLYSVKPGEAWNPASIKRIDLSGYDNYGNSTEQEIELKRKMIKRKRDTALYTCGTDAGALEFLGDLAYAPDIYGCPYESLN
jgi:hypothetical protein